MASLFGSVVRAAGAVAVTAVAPVHKARQAVDDFVSVPRTVCSDGVQVGLGADSAFTQAAEHIPVAGTAIEPAHKARQAADDFVSVPHAVSSDGVQGGCLGADGTITQIVEHVPFFGYGVSAAHAITGDESRAKRAAARCTNSNVVTSAVVTAGFSAAATGCAACGIAACASAGAVGTLAGNSVQCGIEATYNEQDKRNVGQEKLDQDAKAWAVDVAYGAAGGALGECIGGALGQSVGEYVATAVGECSAAAVMNAFQGPPSEDA
jgi:hypothetical protein